ncbi:MAG: DUF262 domain-containing protein [bacterium]
MQTRTDYEFSEVSLEVLLSDVTRGRVQVPEFQRDVNLTPRWIADLVASVSLGYPVGAITLLEVGSPLYRIPSRAIHGAPETDQEPRHLLVDGHHRVSAVYQALASRPPGLEDPQGEALCLDIALALDANADRSDALVWTKRSEIDRPTCALFPLDLVFAPASERENWEAKFLATDAPGDSNRRTLLRGFKETVLAMFEQYRVPVIGLGEPWTAWTIRMRSGSQGRELTQKYMRHP